MLPKYRCLESRFAFFFTAAILAIAAVTPVEAGGGYIPVVARGAGAHGSFTQSDVWIANGTAASATVSLALLPTGLGTGSNTNILMKTVDVPAGRTIEIEDVVEELFGLASGVGALVVDAPDGVLAGSRTYDAGSGGTYGESILAIPGSDSIPPGATGYLLSPSKSNKFRTNLGLVNIANATLTVNVSIKSTSGGELGFKQFQVPGRGHAQINDIFSAAGASPSGQAQIQVAGDQSFFAYASVVDNGTNDPTIEIARTKGIGAGRELVVPAAAHADGANGTKFRTDLRLTNPNSWTVIARLFFHPRGGVPSGELPVILAPGQTYPFDDIVGLNFGATGAGMIRISATGPVVGFSRLYNQAAIGTSGQAIPALPIARTIYPGAPVELTGLSKSAEERTNVGFVNASDRGVTVDARLLDAAGLSVGTKSVFLAAGEAAQWDDVFAVMGVAASEGARLVVSSTPATAASTSNPETAGLFAYASVIDNRTGDPSFLAGQPSIAAVVAPQVSSFTLSADTVCGAATQVSAYWTTTGTVTGVKLTGADGEQDVPAAGSAVVRFPANGTIRLVVTGPGGTTAVRVLGAAESTPVVSKFELLSEGPFCPASSIDARWETSGASAVYLSDGSALLRPMPANSGVEGLPIDILYGANLELIAVSACGSSSKTVVAELWDNGIRTVSVRANPVDLYYYRWGQTAAGCCAVRYKPLQSEILVSLTNPDKIPVKSIEASALYGTLRQKAGTGGGGMTNTLELIYVGPTEWITDIITVTVTDECGNLQTGTATVNVNICFPPEAVAGCACPEWCDARGSDPSVPWYDCPDELFGWCEHSNPVPANSTCPYCYYASPGQQNPPAGYSCVDPQ